MRRHPNRGRGGLHTACGGGPPTQDVVRVSDMDGERNLSTPRRILLLLRKSLVTFINS
jgi:hypothetical protein